MKIAEFQAVPSIIEHWGQVGPHVEALLIDHMIETADGSKGGENSQAEIGAIKELARVIKIFRQVERKPGGTTRAPITRPLNRNQTEETKK